MMRRHIFHENFLDHFCMLLLLLSRFSLVRLCATPKTAAHQATRPWDSPGKNTGVGCHFFLQCMKVKSESEVAQSCLTLHDPMDCSRAKLCNSWLIQWAPHVVTHQQLTCAAVTCVCVRAQSCLILCDPMDCNLPAPLSIGFCRQRYWSGLPGPPPGDLPN